MMGDLQSRNPAWAWRYDRYREMGFEPDDAEELADVVVTDYVGKGSSKKAYQRPLDWQVVKSKLDAGCSLHHALLIYL